MLEKISDANLRVYVVWLPILGGDREDGAEQMAGLIPDHRAVQFWDQEQSLGKIYAKVLGLPPGTYAWDVYLVFPPGVRWENEAPRPIYWMHQLFYPSENYLNGEKLHLEVERTLRSAVAPPQAEASPRCEPSVVCHFADLSRPGCFEVQRRLSLG